MSRLAIVCVAVVVAALAGAATAMDFTSLAPGKTTDLGDGHLQVQHSLKKTFTHAETGRETFVDLEATVEYHNKWNFLQLSDHAAPGMMGVNQRCHAATVSETTISIKPKDETAKQAILAGLAKENTVLLARDLRCGARGVFGHLVSFNATRADGFISMEMQNAQFEDVYRHAKVNFKTNHIHHHAFTPEESAAILLEDKKVEDTGVAPSARHMDQQHWHHHHWFHHVVHHIEHEAHHAASHVSHDIHKAYDGVKHVAKDIGHDVEHFAHEVENVYEEATGLLAKAEQTLKHIISLAEGNFNVNKQWTVAKAHWGNPALMYEYFTPAPSSNGYKLDHYGSFDIIVLFQLDIHYYRVEHFLAAIEADAEAAIAASATGSYSASYNKQVADIRLPSINFAIGPVPVHIQPYIPVVVGLSINAGASIQFGAQAKGHIEYGFQYQGGKFSTIHTHTFSFNHKFTEPTQPKLGITASVTPSIALNIDFLGGPIASLRIIAACNLVNSDELVITAQPVAVLSAVFKLRILGHDVLGPKTLGPYTHDGTVYHLATIHIPNLDPWAKKRFNALEAVGQADKDAATTGPTIGGVFRGAAYTEKDTTTTATFQIVEGTSDKVFLMGVISKSAPGQVGTIVAPYTMGLDNKTNKVYLRPNRSMTYATTSSPTISPVAPSFEDVQMVQSTKDGKPVTVMTLNEQVGGSVMASAATGAFTTNNAVYAATADSLPQAQKTETTTTTGGASPKKDDSSDDNNHKLVVYGAAGAACLGLMAVVAVVAVRASRKPARAAVPAEADDNQAMV